MPQRNDNNRNQGGQGGQGGRTDVQRTPGVDQGGGRIQSPQRDGGRGGQQMDRPDAGDTDGGSGRRGVRRDDDQD